jgi:hypothetical protein
MMGFKKYAKAKELFESYLKMNPSDSQAQSCLKKCVDILDLGK